ncbi:uncharacterized protein FTJAE_11451 [Fusarium tjaetaba]|uniref:NACHT domain-containing protein n=1 Tax=Fusarium tjaetaba TaxID=1567544 RepID=A0A8H5VGD7_9HYPO|nr:uncharacterized protein FTJAE_11451 [Fusarium tjaetaba]KAF5621110.1 hypothetical protein FTJAE_11451 [Fusarium tjaetaba]
MKDTLRRLKVHTRERFERLRITSDEGDSAADGGHVASDRITSDSRQSHTKIHQREDQADVAAESGDTSMPTTQSDADPSSTENIDFSTLLQKLEKFLESEDGDVEAGDPKPPGNPSEATDNSRLETIQKNAEQRLKNFSEAHLSFTIRGQPIVVWESILKAVQVINTLKPIISGAVAAEPSAALAWAGVTTILPQDEDAATGLTNVIFLMARYRDFHEQDFVSHLQSSCQSDSSRESLSHVRDDLVSVYGKIYIYEARFVLQYGRRNKVHRALRNALNADGWKQSWLDIETISQRIDKGVNAEVNITTLRSWQVVKDIQERTERVEFLQHETLRVVQGFDRRQLLQSLQVTGNAVFDSRRTSKVEAVCLPGTRRHILQTIQDWTNDPDSKMIFWLQGMAGTGKTSIALTVASSLEARAPFTDPLKQPSRAFLGASFFFAQGDATRNSTAEFFRTIAWCLADALPDVGIRIAEAIKDNPGIHMKAPQQQLQKLIIKPLELLDQKTFVPLQLVVVIDALDECLEEDAEDLLGMLANLEKLHQIQLRLFITSRREGHISMAMENLPSRLFQTNRLNKIDSSPGSNNDIAFYLSESLGSIATRWRVTDGGVNEADINRLVQKADGLFIYAATACRFLDSPHFVNRRFRERRLNLFFEDQWETQGPQHTMDDIYHKVLTFPETDGWSQEEKIPFYTDISQLIGFIVVLFRPTSVETLSHLLPTTITRDDVKYYLGQLHSIIDVPENPGFPLLLVHLSFRDFILDPKRSERLPFSISELEMHHEVLYRCFALMNSKLEENICRLSLPGTLVSEVDPSHIASHIPPYLQYACRYWADHLIQTHRKFLAKKKSGDAEYQASLVLVYSFLKENLLSWLEVMAFIGEASSIIPVFSQLGRFIELVAACQGDSAALYHVELEQLVLLILPSERWVSGAAKDIYELSISIDNRIVAVRFDDSVDFWDMTPKIQRLIGSYRATWSVFSSFLFISPDEMIGIYESHTHMVDVFDLVTGESIGTFSRTFVKQDPNEGPLRAHVWGHVPVIRILGGQSTSTFGVAEGPPDNVEFLDGNNLAISYSSKMATKQWTVIDGSMKSFEVRVQALTYSPDGQFVLLQLDLDDQFQVWDRSLTKRIAVYDRLASMVFVPQTSHLVSLSLLGNLQVLSYDPKCLTLDTVNTFNLSGMSHGSTATTQRWRMHPLHVSQSGEVVAIILDCRDHGSHNTLLQLWNVPRREKIKEIRMGRRAMG